MDTDQRCSLFSWRLLQATVLVLATLSVSGQRDHEYWVGEECNRWGDIVSQLNRTVRSLSISCATNSPCTGVDCLAAIQMMNVTTVRFGLEFYPCSKPVVLQLYFYASGRPFTQRFNVVDKPLTSNISIPLSAIQISDQVELSAFVLLYIGPLAANNHVTVEVNVSVSGKFAGAPVFNEELVLIPKTDVPVPKCEGGRLETPMTRPPVSPPSLTTPSPSAQHDCYDHISTGKLCNMSVMYSCGNHELCTGSPPTCQCWAQFYWDGQMCRNNSEGCHPQSTGNNNGLIVAVTCLGVALMIGTLIAVLRCRYVRKRQRYAAHELLTNHEPDDQLSDDPDPPMIEA